MARHTAGDYLLISPDEARDQLRSLLVRQVRPGGRQVPFNPVETLLCFGVAFRVNHRQFGGSTAHLAPSPVPELARLFRRPPSSILAKMANLDGSRTHGASNDLRVAIALSRDPSEYLSIYSLILSAARSIGIDNDTLPNFLNIGSHDEPFLHDLVSSSSSLPDWEIELDTIDEARRLQKALDNVSLDDTERLLLTRTRIGQQRFASQVLDNYSHTCAFCGLSMKPLSSTNNYRMLVASHIKPWRESSALERTDPRNGISACPTHDAAFDQGLISIDVDLSLILSPTLAAAAEINEQLAHNFKAPGISSSLLLPNGANPPDASQLEWHRANILQAA